MLAASSSGQAPPPLSRDFGLGPSLGQCCGGSVTLLFEAVLPPAWRVALFGAGHVGRALVRLLGDQSEEAIKSGMIRIYGDLHAGIGAGWPGGVALYYEG